jgi:hypothetical protein
MLFSEFLEKQAAGAMSRIKNLDIVSDIKSVINRLSPAPDINYSDLPEIRSMRFADLSTGVKGRLQTAASKAPVPYLDPRDWLRDAKKRKYWFGGSWFDDYKHDLFDNETYYSNKMSGADRRYDFFDLYKKYLERASAQDPKLSRLARRTKQLKSRRDALTQAKTDDGGLSDELGNRVAELMQQYNLDTRSKRNIPTLTVYEANTTFPTTHHLASAELSSRANKLAAEADSSVEFIPSVPGTGYMYNRNPFHRIHRPGQERTLDDVLEARANTLIGSSNEYEAAFDKLHTPNAKAIYSRLTPDVQSFLGVTEDQIAHYAPDLQSLSRMALYKGRRDGSTMPPVAKLLMMSGKTTDRLSDIMPSRYAQQVTRSYGVKPDIDGLRWYTPWTHMGSGYAVGEEAALTTPWVKLNTEQIAKLRNLYKQDVENTHAATDAIADTFKDTINNSPNRQTFINNTRIDYLSRKTEEQLAKLVSEGKIPHTLYKTIMGLE